MAQENARGMAGELGRVFGRMWTMPRHLGRLRVSWRTVLSGLVLLAIFTGVLAAIQFSTADMPDNDGFYHIKLAYLMRTQGLKPDFPWLPLTILNEREFYDHHFLFHVALMPFTFGDLRLGAKWASVIFAALAFLSLWRLLDRQRVPLAGLWSLGLLAVSEAFLFRMSITRAQSLSLLVLLIGLNWMLAGNYRRLALLGFVYVWLYNAFPLLLALAAAYTLAVAASERRLEWRPLAYSAAGIAAGLLINPYFPYNVIFAYQHMLPKLADTTSISVGNEWYPYDTGQLLSNSPLALLAFASGAFALGLSARRMQARTAAAFLLAALFGLMTFQARRFVEYFPAFALLFAAFSWTEVIQSLTAEQADQGLLGQATAGRRQIRRYARAAPAVLLALILLLAGLRTFDGAVASIGRSKPYTLYQGASIWLQANTPAGSRVFQTDWDDFPRLFFYNTHNTYLVGLDPTYLQLYDAGLYTRWTRITQGKVEQPSNEIAGRFGAAYVLSDLRHGNFLDRAADDPGLLEVYRDGDAVVYRVAGQ